MNYYRRYIGDYHKKTSRLSLLEHGAYALLLDYYYAEERPLPPDWREIYRMLRALDREEQKAIDKILGRYFVLTDDGYHNTRADEELGVASAVIATARENGKRGGRPRKTRDETRDITEDETGGITGLETRDITRDEPGNNHPPTPNHHPPTASPNLQPPTPSQGSKAVARASRLPPDWILPRGWGEWALRKRPEWSAETVRDVAELFRDHWLAQPGQRGVKADWQATWRNWVRREATFARSTGNIGKQAALEERNRQVAARWTPPEEKAA